MLNTNSERISLLRPVLIFLVVSTHIQGSLYRADLQNLDFTLNNFIHTFISGSLAVSALPLLSIISGYLGAYTYKKYHYLTTVQKKISRVVVPMLFWNLVMALFIYKLQSQGISFRKDLALYPFNIEQWLYSLTAVFRMPANPPLYFLRELFICFLLIPILFQISKSKVATAIGVVAIAYMSVQGINLGFFHRIDIYGFFLIGLFLNNQSSLTEQFKCFSLPAWHLGYLFGFFVALLLLTAYALRPEHPGFIYYLKAMTVVGPLALWILSGYISGPIKRFLLWVSPASFAVFLGHILFLNIYWELWIKLFGTHPLNTNYLWFWISSFILCYSIMGVIAFLYRKAIKYISHINYQKNNAAT